MPKACPDERLVYVALRRELAICDTSMGGKKIRQKIMKQESTPEVRSLLHDYGIDTIANIAKLLFDDGVYHSTIKAKIRFPEVFEVSPAQSEERCASEAEAARHEADAFKAAGGIARVKPCSQSKPSLYPVYLPKGTQIRLLGIVQGVLEAACFEYTRKHAPDVSQAQEWDCAEAVELNIWAGVFASKFPGADIDGQVAFWDALAKIRHAAVHRMKVTASRIEDLLHHAEALCRLLEDEDRREMIVRLRRALSPTIEELKGNKDLLEARMRDRLAELAAQRKEIKRQELLAIEDMLRDDAEFVEKLTVSLENMLKIATISAEPHEEQLTPDAQEDEADEDHTCAVSEASV